MKRIISSICLLACLPKKNNNEASELRVQFEGLVKDANRYN